VIAYLLCGADEVPADDAWLLPAEHATLSELSRAKRRADWRLGRWVAKHAVARALELFPDVVEIRSAEDGAPHACVDGASLGATISISHGGGTGLCAVAVPPLAVGCDVEFIEQRPSVFEEDWFTPSERELVGAASPAEHDLLVTLFWSAKESALKALRSGLRRDTRSVVVDEFDGETDGAWHRLRIRDLEGPALEGWWRENGQSVISVVSAAMPTPPSPL
jgi:4'-phosphopantetheinyl transferase